MTEKARQYLKGTTTFIWQPFIWIMVLWTYSQKDSPLSAILTVFHPHLMVQSSKGSPDRKMKTCEFLKLKPSGDS